MGEGAAARDRRRRARAAAAFGAVVLVALLGCWSRPEPELLRRHAAYEVADTTGLVDVAVFTVPAGDRRPGARLPELSASAQSALIRAVADKTHTPEAFLRTLGRPVGSPRDAASAVDRTRFRRRVVVSVENRAARPAQGPGGRWVTRHGARISRLRIAVGLGTEAEFRSWNRFASRYETVDLGEMSFRRDRTHGLSLDVVPGSVARELEGAGLDRTRSSSLDEELPLRSRYVSTGMLLPDSMILLQEGAVGIDLTGNVVLEVDLDVRDAPEPARTIGFAGLFRGDGTPRPADSVHAVTRRLVHAPGPVDDVRGALRFEAVVRTVAPGAGDATWAEGDDRARYLVESAEAPPVVLLRAAELRASVWQLATRECRDFLHIAGGGGRPVVVQTETPEGAFALLRWLRRSGATEVGRRPLHLGPERELVPTDAGELAVRLQPLNWRPAEGGACP